MTLQQKPAEVAGAPRVEESVAAIVRRLASAQKSAVGAPAYSRWINRPIGRVLAAVSYRAGLTPNGVTAISAAFSLAGIVVLAAVSAHWWTGIVVTACLVIGYAFDSADGQLARLRGGGSPAGEWLDHMVDATKISSLHLAVLISFYRIFEDGSMAWCLVPVGYVIINNTTFFGMILGEQLRRAKGQQPVARAAGPLRALLVIPTDYGLLCLIFVLLGAPYVFVTAYVVLFVGNALFCAKWIKWFRDMSELDPQAVAVSS